ncbi:hypothetical protein EV122DRAFT_255973 [Schizophyllum commune]
MIAAPSRAPPYKSISFTTFTFSATAKASLLNARVLEGGRLPPRRLQSHEPPKDLLPPIAHATAADGSQGVSASVLARTPLVHAVSVSQGLSGAWSMVRLFLAIYCIASPLMTAHMSSAKACYRRTLPLQGMFTTARYASVSGWSTLSLSVMRNIDPCLPVFMLGLLAAPPQEKRWLFLKRGHVCFVFRPRRTVGSHQIDFCGHLGAQLSGVLIGVASTVNHRLAGHGINRYLGSPMQSCVVVWNDTVAGCYASTECPRRGEGARGESRTTAPAGSHIGGIFQIIVIKTARCEAGPVILPDVHPLPFGYFRHGKSRYGRKLRQEVRRLLACAYDAPNTNGLAKPMLYTPAVCVATSWTLRSVGSSASTRRVRAPRNTELRAALATRKCQARVVDRTGDIFGNIRRGIWLTGPDNRAAKILYPLQLEDIRPLLPAHQSCDPTAYVEGGRSLRSNCCKVAFDATVHQQSPSVSRRSNDASEATLKLWEQQAAWLLAPSWF